MARPSKTTPFDIYEDSSAKLPGDSIKEELHGGTILTGLTLAQEEDFITDSEGEGHEFDQATAHHADDEQEYFETGDSSHATAQAPLGDAEVEQPYTPTLDRPQFLRPATWQGTRTSSSLGGSTKSPRIGTLRKPKSRIGTPRSQASGSPGARKHGFANAQHGDAEQHSLVLLHLKLLPVVLPWSLEIMRDVLPPRVLDNLQLLKSKATNTVLKRGILIPHPGDDYELLEERLLESLELIPPRITKCGHFRARQSIGSCASAGSDGSDSGLGSSVEGLDADNCSEADLCSACHHHVSATKGKWWIRVFAANGLMRANTWAAAWSEMERVDVEIMPFISDRLRARLHERSLEQGILDEEEDVLGDAYGAIDGSDGLPQEALAEATTSSELIHRNLGSPTVTGHELRSERRPADRPEEISKPAHGRVQSIKSQASGKLDLPPIYRKQDIPLSVLLRNYILLLAQDRKKVVILFLALLGLCFVIRPATIPRSELSFANTPAMSEMPVIADEAMAVQTVVDAASCNEADHAEMTPSEPVAGRYPEASIERSTGFPSRVFTRRTTVFEPSMCAI